MIVAATRRAPVIVTENGRTYLAALVCWHTRGRYRDRARVETHDGRTRTVRHASVQLIEEAP